MSAQLRRSLWALSLCATAFGCSRVAPIDNLEVSSKEIKPAQPIEIAADDVPWWRGTDRDGTSTGAEPPTEWDEDSGVLWKTPIPGRGHSTPIIVGDGIFLTTADESENVQLAIALDRVTGKQLWSTKIHDGHFPRKHPENSHASATPASDGKSVYVVFINDDALWVTALDLDGKVLWQTNVGPFQSQHGYGSAPVLYEDLIIVNGDNQAQGYVAALHRDTGDIVWRTGRPATGSYATPTVAEVAGKPQLLLAGADKVRSYDPRTGELIWSCDGPTKVAANTLVTDGELVIASAGYPEKEILCIRGDGSGDVTSSHIVWRSNDGVAYVPTPMIDDGKIYILSDNGILTTRDLGTGKELGKARLTGNFRASLVRNGDLMFVPNMDGVCHVVRTGDRPKVIARNVLDSEGGFASPVITDGKIYLRTGDHLYCIGTGDASVAEAASKQ